MSARSTRHHEIPKWLLKRFCQDPCEGIWIGFKDTHEVKLVGLNGAFFRQDGNTRTSYHNLGGGTFQEVKSDQEEVVLTQFDGKADRATRELIALSRQSRDDSSVVPRFSLETVEICKQLIIAQSRRTRESQDRIGLSKNKYEQYLDLFFKRAEEVGHVLPSRESLLKDPGMIKIFDVIAHNIRAKFASGNHPILVNKEKNFLASLGLQVAVLAQTTPKFVIGSHGTTIVETTEGKHSWLPLAPDVAISLLGQPRAISVGIYIPEFVECHNRAALLGSARIAGWSKEQIQELLALLN